MFEKLVKDYSLFADDGKIATLRGHVSYVITGADNIVLGADRRESYMDGCNAPGRGSADLGELVVKIPHGLVGNLKIGHETIWTNHSPEHRSPLAQANYVNTGNDEEVSVKLMGSPSAVDDAIRKVLESGIGLEVAE